MTFSPLTSLALFEGLAMLLTELWSFTARLFELRTLMVNVDLDVSERGSPIPLIETSWVAW